MSAPSLSVASDNHPYHRSASPVSCHACTLRCGTSFRGLSAGELQLVTAMKCCDIALEAGQEVFREGQANSLIYTLYDGWAVRTLTLANGGRQILDFVLPGDLIGLGGYLQGSSPHSVSALTPLRLCALNATGLPALLRAQPDLAMALLAARTEEQHRGDTRLALIGRSGAAQRIGYLLLELRARLRNRGLFDGQSCQFPVQRLQLADAVGLSRAHVMRALRELKDRGLAQVSGGVLTIPNARNLARFSGYSLAYSREQYPIL